MDDETSLPDLAGLELDDSDEEFWKMDEVSIVFIYLFTIKEKRAYCCYHR